MSKIYGHSSDGQAITEDMIQEWVAEAERGYSDVPLKRGGRPLMGSNPAGVRTVRLSPELDASLLARAEAEHKTPSTVMREALERHLVGV